jgi:1-phosphofructokinase family hexose kinase
VILTVTPNPAIDLTWRADGLTLGTTQRVVTGVSRAGGKGLNVARVLHSTSHRVLALTTAGGSTGTALAADLQTSGIPHRLLSVVAETRRSVALVDESTGDASILNEVGAPLTADESAALVDEASELGRAADVVAICGSLPPGFAPGLLGDLVLRLADAGVPVVVDTSGPGILTAARAGARVLKPNRDELAEVTGYDRPLEGARALIDLGAGLVMVSLGADGLMLVGGGGVQVTSRLPRTLRGNPTGAGDAAVAAVAAALASGAELRGRTAAAAHAREDLARRAVAWSASAVLMPLAGELSSEHTALADEVVVETHEERR